MTEKSDFLERDSEHNCEVENGISSPVDEPKLNHEVCFKLCVSLSFYGVKKY